jgi:hypothetical protein
MTIVVGLVVLGLLIGFVCYSNRCNVRNSRALPKEIADKLM